VFTSNLGSNGSQIHQHAEHNQAEAQSPSAGRDLLPFDLMLLRKLNLLMLDLKLLSCCCSIGARSQDLKLLVLDLKLLLLD
jgi:hypothetical protein